MGIAVQVLLSLPIKDNSETKHFKSRLSASKAEDKKTNEQILLKGCGGWRILQVASGVSCLAVFITSAFTTMCHTAKNVAFEV